MNKEELETMTKGVKLGAEADAILKSEAFAMAKVAASGDILQGIYTVDVSANKEHALELIRSLQSMNRFMEQLEDIISDGSFYQTQLEQLNAGQS